MAMRLQKRGSFPIALIIVDGFFVEPPADGR